MLKLAHILIMLLMFFIGFSAFIHPYTGYPLQYVIAFSGTGIAMLLKDVYQKKYES